MLIEINQFGKIIFLNSDSGDASFNKSELMTNFFNIDENEYLNDFKTNTYTFCLSISDKCNLNCKYCFNKEKNNKLLDPEEAINNLNFLFEKFNDGKKYFIDLSGIGEPLLNLECIKEIIKYKDRKMEEIRKEIVIMFSTNGLLLSKELVEFLQTNEILFGISIDYNQKLNNFLRGNNKSDNFTKIMENIKQIKHREFLGVSVSITKHLFDINEAIDFLKEYFTTLSFRIIRDNVIGINNKETLDQWINQYDKLAIRLLNEAKDGNLSTFQVLMNGDDVFGRYLYLAFGNYRTLNRCDSFISRISYFNGRLYGCSAQNKIDNFGVEPNEIEKVRKLKIAEAVHSCIDCAYKLYCGGHCEVEEVYSNINIPFNCKLHKHLINLALYLKLKLLEENYEIFKKINLLARNKYQRNNEFDRFNTFIENNKNLSFKEAKNLYYKINNKEANKII